MLLFEIKAPESSSMRGEKLICAAGQKPLFTTILCT